MSDLCPIKILGYEDDEEDRAPWDELRLARAAIPPETLNREVTSFLESMSATFANLPDAVGDYKLDTVELEVQISAKGSLSLLGTGGEVGGTGGLKLVLKPR